MPLSATAFFIIKLLILFGVVYLIIKNIKVIALVIAALFLFFALQNVFGYDAVDVLTQIFTFPTN